MKLLVITQALDKNHPILGFFVRWVEEFAKHFEHIHVIALQVGEHSLPKNVTVHSLGKENGARKLQRLFTLYSLLFTLRREYDGVFVHMNPEYIVLAGWLWRLTGKKIGLWYNHTVGGLLLKIAQPFTNVVFHTSPYAYTARYRNAKHMPAGIDTDIFKPHPEVKKVPKSMYFQGRIAPAKRVHVILEVFAELYAEGKAHLLTLVGPEDEEYTKPLREKYTVLIESGAIVFKGPLPNVVTPTLYAAHEISVNLTDDGNYDKTVLESLACGTPVVVGSKSFRNILSPEWIVESRDPVELGRKFQEFFSHHAEHALFNPERIRNSVVENESLAVLGERIYTVYSG